MVLKDVTKEEEIDDPVFDIRLSLMGILTSLICFYQSLAFQRDLEFSNMTQFLDIIFPVFNNWDIEEEERRRAEKIKIDQNYGCHNCQCFKHI